MIPNQYKTTQQFNSITKELIINKNNLIIIHINIRSLRVCFWSTTGVTTTCVREISIHSM